MPDKNTVQVKRITQKDKARAFEFLYVTYGKTELGKKMRQAIGIARMFK